jgi:hypothetical protein
MKNCIILGSGRSGTSLAAGTLNQGGYFMGNHLNPPNETNPKGQFEDIEITSINEDILAQVTRRRPSNFLGDVFFRTRPVFGQRWLSRIPLDTKFDPSLSIEKRIKQFLEHEPYCYKDPRFSYTLSVWRAFIKNTVFICVFRHPSITVSSILFQKKMVPHLKNFSISSKHAFAVWELMYSHILNKHFLTGGDWLFVHYDQLLDGSVFEKLETELETEVNKNFADRRLKRSKPQHRVSERIISLYYRLCDLAGYGADSDE